MSPSDPFMDPYSASSAEGSYSSHTTDPFSDSCPSSSIHGIFEQVETIRRPFVGTLPDELSVQPGNQVMVTKVFNDGWAMMQKAESSRNHNHDRGLVPIDCLREPGQEFGAFLQSKRVDSHVAFADFRYS